MLIDLKRLASLDKSGCFDPDHLQEPFVDEPVGEGLILGRQLGIHLSEDSDSLEQVVLGSQS